MLRSIAAYVRRHHIGLIALAVALSGTAYAAATIGPNDIKKNAVKSRHIKGLGGKDFRPLITVNRTATIDDVGQAFDERFGRGPANVFCPGQSRVVGLRSEWLSGNDPQFLVSVFFRGSSAQVVGGYDGGGTAQLQITADCLKPGR
jgi:hypothetical protein